MDQKVQEFQKAELKKKLPEIKAGDIVKVHQKIMEKGKERIQIFEGLVVAVKGNSPLSKRIVVRRIASGVGVERTFPLNMPSLKKVEVTKRTKVKRAKLYYVRNLTGRNARLEEKKDVILPGVETLEEPEEIKEELPKKAEPKKETPKEEVKKSVPEKKDKPVEEVKQTSK